MAAYVHVCQGPGLYCIGNDVRLCIIFVGRFPPNLPVQAVHSCMFAIQAPCDVATLSLINGPQLLSGFYNMRGQRPPMLRGSEYEIRSVVQQLEGRIVEVESAFEAKRRILDRFRTVPVPGPSFERVTTAKRNVYLLPHPSPHRPCSCPCHSHHHKQSSHLQVHVEQNQFVQS